MCTAAIPALQCAPGSDLAGIWVESTATGIGQCNISPADITIERNPQAQCISWGDLAIFASVLGSGNANTNQENTANLLRGGGTTPDVNPSQTANIFTVCARTPTSNKSPSGIQ